MAGKPTRKREPAICADPDGQWLWEHGRPTTLVAAFPGENAAKRLARKFDDWLKFLRGHWDAAMPQRFFWGRFHQDGVALARELQALLIDRAVVQYWRPPQDPRSGIEREIRL